MVEYKKLEREPLEDNRGQKKGFVLCIIKGKVTQ